MTRCTALVMLMFLSFFGTKAQTAWERIERAHNNAERVRSDIDQVQNVRDRIENRDFNTTILSNRIGDDLRNRLGLNSRQEPLMRRVVRETLNRKEDALRRWGNDQARYDQEMFRVRENFNQNMREILEPNQYRNLLNISPRRAIKANLLSRLLF
ncbi:hypothetical protein ACSVH5_13290 [Flavobacterium sp. RSSA_27]|uniref:hypothetical protein n=1 Tax=Flavobacterium sp. RSSA_27 TaxID=3447667 RepID=UPI003F41466F